MTFVKGDPRINRTKPGPGRPPDKIRADARGGVSLAVPRLIKRLRSNPDPEELIKLAMALHKISGMERLEITGADGEPFPPIRIIRETAE